MKKELKAQIIDSLAAEIKQYPNFYVTDIAGLNAGQTSKLRRECFGEGIKLEVVKNTLFAHVLKASENEELKRLQVETAVRAGKIKDLEREIEELRGLPYAKQAPEKTPEEKAFARHFENAKGEFNAMIDTVDEMPENLRMKYKAAMKQLMEVMTALVKEE